MIICYFIGTVLVAILGFIDGTAEEDIIIYLLCILFWPILVPIILLLILV